MEALSILIVMGLVIYIIVLLVKNHNLKRTDREWEIYIENATKTRANKKIDEERQKDKVAFDKQIAIFRSEARLKKEWVDEINAIKNLFFKELNSNLKEREAAYKWIAPLIADAQTILAERFRKADELVAGKRSDDIKTKVNVLINEKKLLLEENHELRYLLEYIKTVIPETEDIIGHNQHDEETTTFESQTDRLSKEEYKNLSDTEKSNIALERYKNRRKRNWEIGRDFERFIGYEYEQLGYDVEYFGIEKRLEDLGRDLIARNDNSILIIQCKYWAKNKIIHEKHIAQLYGTVIMYELEMEDANKKTALFPQVVRGIFITQASLSHEAKRFAKRLRIEIIENKKMGEYPLIKCNIGRDGEKIYHLPGDQQYDTTKIDKTSGECYAFTVEEAESKGFRRAYRWHGGDN